LDDPADKPVMKKNTKRNAPEPPQIYAGSGVVECMLIHGRACMGTHQWRGQREHVVIAVAGYLKTVERTSIFSIHAGKDRQLTIVTEQNIYVGD
jgi:hypothetical protein